MVNGTSASAIANGTNATSATGGNAGGTENNGGTFADHNPFLAVREAQRMVRNYPDDDVGRQSLEQLNEISRRATVAGMSFSNGRPGSPSRVLAGLMAQGQQNQAQRAGMGGEIQRRESTSPRQQQQQQQSQSQQQRGSPTRVRGQEQQSQQTQEQTPPTSANASSDADVANLNLSREDALQRIEELARARPSSAQGGANGVIGPLGPIAMGGGLGMGASAGQGQMQLPSVQYASGSDPFIMPGNDAGIGGGALEPFSNANGTSMAMTMGANGAMGSHTLMHSGLQVFTLGHLMPRAATEDENENGAVWNFDARSAATGAGAGQQGVQQQQSQQGNGMVGPYGTLGGGSEAQAGSSTGIGTREYASANSTSVGTGGSTTMASRPSGLGGSPGGNTQKLRVRRSTFVPGWAVPPRVLLVDDDAVSRKLSSKFLQVFGCTIDVAVDGVVAVNKMNLERYDLVLMVSFSFRQSVSIQLTERLQDIVMPKLDGISATSLIRQFDHMTPIISMTSNSKPNEIMTYYSHGMNDILPKPFTKEGLLSMLEVTSPQPTSSSLPTDIPSFPSETPHPPQDHPRTRPRPPLRRHPPALRRVLQPGARRLRDQRPAGAPPARVRRLGRHGGDEDQPARGHGPQRRRLRADPAGHRQRRELPGAERQLQPHRRRQRQRRDGRREAGARGCRGEEREAESL